MSTPGGRRYQFEASFRIRASADLRMVPKPRRQAANDATRDAHACPMTYRTASKRSRVAARGQRRQLEL
jgi:hypothetical protein